MKKKGITLISLLLLLLSVFCLFSACGKQGELTIKVSGGKEVYLASEFDISDYRLTITHTDGSVQEAVLSMNYIRESDKIKFQTVGTHTITVEYRTAVTTFTVTIEGPDITGVTFTDKEVTYSGKEFSIEPTGIPDGATVKYAGSNTYVEAGVYTVNATVSKLGYKDLNLSATLTINKKVVEKPEADTERYVYNGSEQRYNLSQSDFYTVANAVQTDAGEYKVTVSFLSVKSCEWVGGGSENLVYDFTIEKADYDLSDLVFVDRTFVYDGQEHGVTVIKGLPDGVEAVYEGNGKTEKGEYTVTLTFNVKDTKNYNEISTSKTAKLFICDASEVYSVTFRQNGYADKVFYVKNGEKFDKALIPAVNTQEGYVIKWKNVDYDSIGTDTVVSAEKKANEYVITIGYDNGEKNGKKTVHYADGYSIETPEKEGYDFVGFYVYTTGEAFAQNGKYQLTENVYIVAKWKEKPCKIYFEGMTEEEVPEGSAVKKEGETLYLEAEKGSTFSGFVPKKSGSKFICWTTEDGKCLDLENTIITENLTVKAFYAEEKAGSYCLAFYEEGEEPITVYVAAGGKIEAKDIPSVKKEVKGYDVSWNYDFSAAVTDNAVIKTKQVAKTFKIYYKIEVERLADYKNKYGLILDKDKKMYYQVVTYGEAYTIVSEIKDSKYKLSYFKTEKGVTVRSGKSFTYAEDLTLIPVLYEKTEWSGIK